MRRDLGTIQKIKAMWGLKGLGRIPRAFSRGMHTILGTANAGGSGVNPWIRGNFPKVSEFVPGGLDRKAVL